MRISPRFLCFLRKASQTPETANRIVSAAPVAQAISRIPNYRTPAQNL